MVFNKITDCVLSHDINVCLWLMLYSLVHIFMRHVYWSSFKCVLYSEFSVIRISCYVCEVCLYIAEYK